MKIKSKRDSVRSNVDMTPMIDIVFQLILFFLVSTTFAVLPAIKLNLPVSRTSEGASVQGLMITAQADGTLFVNDKQVELQDLGKELVFFDTGDTKKVDFPVSLEADSEVTNGAIVELFDVIRESGYTIINLRTTSK
ncbi:MAG: biopolymer transporter ExbD [Treponema sp.]|nr:biopolymer transporter ExbD [Treponema sp.]